MFVSARAAAAALVAVAVAVAALAGPGDAAHAATVAGQVKPGKAGATITLSTTVELTPGSYDLTTDSTGTAYLGWLATDASDTDDGELLHLCVLPPSATACAGGIQTVSPGQESGAGWLRILTPSDGPVSLLWYNQISGGSEIAEATVHSGILGRADNVSPAPADGRLLDAAVSPDGDIWTVTTGDAGRTIVVRDQLGNPETTTISTPQQVDAARIAFSSGVPVIAMHDSGSTRHPVRYTYLSDGSWTTVAAVAGTETGNAGLGLVATGAGLRLVAVNSADTPVIARWNGHGFAAPTVLDSASPDPDGHDLVTDASGRAADVSYVGTTVTVTNIADGTHGAVTSFPALGAPAGGDAQLASDPSGRGWVAWAVGSGASEQDTLRLTPVLLPALRRSVAHVGGHGSVTLTGPASCLPVDTTTVSVVGHPKKGWKVASHTLTLGGRKQAATLDGASFTAGRAYALKGAVVFAKAHARSTVTASLRFTACPTP